MIKPDRRSPLDWITLALGTGLFVGMIPPRTATIATLWGIPLAIGLKHLVGWHGYLPVLGALWLIGIPICAHSAKLLGKGDPREVVFDEIVTLPVVYFLAPGFDWRVLVAGFALHRFFDILKPLGIARLERLGGGVGIMADDLLAAVYGLACMHLLYWFQWIR